MNELQVKQVDFLGDTLLEARDQNGDVWVGVSYICNGIGFTKNEKDRQVKKVQADKVLKQGCVKFDAGVFDPNNETIALKLDFLPLWLAKINITPTMESENPDVADKLEAYQLKAKDVLAAAFLPQQKPMTTAEIVAAMAQHNVELERKVLSLETKTAEVEEKLTRHTDRLDSAIEIFSKPLDRSWRKSINDTINRLCVENNLNYQVFKGELYAELEEAGHCDLGNRQTRIRNRMKTAGTTSRERQAISKIDVIDRDPKLKLIFDGIVRKHQAQLTGGK